MDEDDVGEDATLMDEGLDSLGATELSSKLAEALGDAEKKATAKGRVALANAEIGKRSAALELVDEASGELLLDVLAAGSGAVGAAGGAAAAAA